MCTSSSGIRVRRCSARARGGATATFVVNGDEIRYAARTTRRDPSGSSGLERSAVERAGGRARRDVQLAQDVLHVALHSELRDVEPRRDLAVGRAARDELEDLAL